MSNAVAIPQAFVDIYPADGGPVQLRGAQIVALTVEKTLLDPNGGRFMIELPPTGPRGANARPSWAEIITPMSLCIIGLSRWVYSSIVMVGVVERVSYEEIWTSGQPTRRAIIVRGCDFQYYFRQLTWNEIVVLSQGTGANAVGGFIGNQGLGLPAILGGAVAGGDGPEIVAQAWWDEIVGPKGILGRTTISYKLTKIIIANAIGTLFEKFPGDFIIPTVASFLGNLGSYDAKFRDILPFPLYEVFCMTGPIGLFAGATARGGFSFGIDEIVNRASIYYIGRVNPLPVLTVATEGPNSYRYTGVDTTRWEALPVFTPDSNPLRTFLFSGTEEVKNFYIVGSNYLSGIAAGTGNGNISPFIYQFGGLVDLTSMERYGLREESISLSWFSDVGRTEAVHQDFQQLIADISVRVASFYHPTPLMWRGAMSYPLRPDILPGCRLHVNAFSKLAPIVPTTDTWAFYIEGIRHQYVFGGASTTELRLSRGLPAYIYTDAAPDGTLQALHTGNVTKFEDTYDFTPGASPNLQPINILNAKQFLANIQKIFQTPQPTTAASGVSG